MVGSGPVAEVLTGEAVSHAFGVPVAVERRDGQVDGPIGARREPDRRPSPAGGGPRTPSDSVRAEPPRHRSDPDGAERSGEDSTRMGMPKDVGVVDTMVGFPHADMKEAYRFITRQTKDVESQEEFEFPVEYIFKDVPGKELRGSTDPIGVTLREMDLWGVEMALIGVGDPSGTGAEAVERFPDRFIPCANADPNDGMAGIRRLVDEYETYGVRAVGVFPAGTFPQVPINDKKMYPLYAKCVELGIPIFCCAGIPGPRLKAACQHVELIDEVMFDFPELVFVTRHGCEPWTDLAVKLMLKWPGLHYSTSAFAPRYYPQAIVDYANTRGADKIIYAGYFPMGLSLERIMGELPSVGFKDEVWPKFLRDQRPPGARPGLTGPMSLGAHPGASAVRRGRPTGSRRRDDRGRYRPVQRRDQLWTTDGAAA